LRQAERYASSTAGAKSFDFMSSSLPGNAENYFDYLGSVSNAQDVLRTYVSEGKMDAASLMRMAQFAETYGTGEQLPEGWSWEKIYEAASKASPDGTISKDLLEKMFGPDFARTLATAM
jgi:hypothetical protein